MKAAAEGMRFQLARALSTVFWIGYFPVAPGTAASAVALLLYLLFPLFQQPSVLAAGVLLQILKAQELILNKLRTLEKKKNRLSKKNLKERTNNKT